MFEKSSFHKRSRGYEHFYLNKFYNFEQMGDNVMTPNAIIHLAPLLADIEEVHRIMNVRTFFFFFQFGKIFIENEQN